MRFSPAPVSSPVPACINWKIKQKQKTKNKDFFLFSGRFATTLSWALCTHLALGYTIHGCYAALFTAQLHHMYTSYGWHFMLVALNWLGQYSWIPRDSVSEPTGLFHTISYFLYANPWYCLLSIILS